MHMPGGVEMTFLITILEANGAWRELNGGGGPFT